MDEKLKKYCSETPFSVPKNYFDEFDSRVKKRVMINKPVRKSWFRVPHVVTPMIGIAAMFLIVILIYMGSENGNVEQLSSENIAIPRFFNYSPGDFYDDHELLEAVAEIGLTEIELFPDNIATPDTGDEELTMASLFY